MDSLLAGYGSDSSGSSSRSSSAAAAAAASATVASVPSSSTSLETRSSSAVDPSSDNTHREGKRPKVSPTPEPSSAPSSSNVADPGLRWLPPETRNEEAADATLVHWPKDYLTPLQERAEKAIALSAAAAATCKLKSPMRGETMEPVAFSLQNSHEFTNPHQLKDAAKRLNIRDALGSTLRTQGSSAQGLDSQP